MSFKKFWVDGELPDGWKQYYLERIKLRAFEDLTPDDEDEEKMGWVPIERPLERSFPLASVVYNNYLNLGFRRDRYAISPERFRAELAAVSREFLEKNQVDRLSRFQKEDLTKMVRNDLKRRSLPTMKVTDMSWDLDTGVVRFWSQAGKLCETFQAYFEDTFGLKLLPGGPYINAMQLELDPEAAVQLASVEPSNFVDGTVGITG